MLPQNMARWHIKYLKLKKCEKQWVWEEFSDLPLKQVMRPSCERCPFCTQRKGASLFPKTDRRWKESEWTGLAVSLFTTLSSGPFVLLHFSTNLHSSWNLASQHPGLNISLVLISLWRLLCHIKLVLNKFVRFSLVNLSFVIEAPAENLEG